MPGLFPLSEAMSPSLLQLYIEQTISVFLAVPESFRDPFVHDVIPLAFEDPLVMEAMLSVGGVPHGLQAEDDALEAKRLIHYGRAIKELKLALTRRQNEVVQDPIRFLLVTVLLCEYEVSHSTPCPDLI